MWSDSYAMRGCELLFRGTHLGQPQGLYRIDLREIHDRLYGICYAKKGRCPSLWTLDVTERLPAPDPNTRSPRCRLRWPSPRTCTSGPLEYLHRCIPLASPAKHSP